MRRLSLFALTVGVSGTLTFWFVGRFPLAIGWWWGSLIGFINYYFLRFGIQKVQSTPGKGMVSSRISRLFFLRYLLLAGAFFLVLRFGKDQLGSSVGGFLSFYVVLLLDYLIQFWKQKRTVS